MSRNRILASVVLASLCLGVPSVASAQAPTAQTSSGIRVLEQTRIDDRMVELRIKTDAVRGDLKIRVLLPAGYDPADPRRYPVLYLLHGGSNPANPATSSDWSDKGGVVETTAGSDLIVVMPDGGNGGWYTDWAFPGSAGPLNWQTFHMDQMVPFIDQNFKTVANKRGRAIAGLSMGGYGALRYAARYPENFAFVASFSGALNMLNPQQQRVIYVTEKADGKPTDGPFGVGSPLPVAADAVWAEADPVASTSFPPYNLAGMKVALYTGSGNTPNDPEAPFPTNVEGAIEPSSYRLAMALNEAGVPFTLTDYGRGEGIADCEGEHTWGCWTAALRDVLPDMMEEFDRLEPGGD